MRWKRRSITSGEALVRTLYHDHGRALLGYATRLTGDRWQAEEVFQETLLRAWRHADELSEAAGSIRGWLFTVAQNIVRDRARRRTARPVEVAVPAATPESLRVDDHAQRVVDSMLAQDIVERLSDELRAVVVELYLRGRTVMETADVLGIPVGTVKSRSYRALRAMRDLGSGLAAAQEVAR